MSKEQNVINYYVLCNKLKNVIRTGWKDWNVQRDRIESVAEHIYGVQMLAIAMQSEFEYDINIEKVIFMLAIHEIGETVIGDLTQFQISKQEKRKIENEAVHNILKDLINGKQIEELYVEENCVDLKNQTSNISLEDERVQKLMKSGESWGTMWLKFSQSTYPYDDNFRTVSNYAIKEKIKKEGK